MGDKKNIDRLFQEKFKDFEAFPEKDLWSGIEAKLNAPSTLPAEAPKKDGRTIPFFWWRLGGIAATIALLLSIGFNLVFTDPESPDMDPLEKITREHRNKKHGRATKPPGLQKNTYPIRTIIPGRERKKQPGHHYRTLHSLSGHIG